MNFEEKLCPQSVAIKYTCPNDANVHLRSMRGWLWERHFRQRLDVTTNAKRIRGKYMEGKIETQTCVVWVIGLCKNIDCVPVRSVGH